MSASLACGPGSVAGSGSADGSGEGTGASASTGSTAGLDCSASDLPAPLCHTRQAVETDVGPQEFVVAGPDAVHALVGASGDIATLLELDGTVLATAAARTSNGHSVVDGDFDGDGVSDVAVVAPGFHVTTFTTSGLGELGTIPPEPSDDQSVMAVQWATPLDVDRDGISELLVNTEGTIELWSRAGGQWSMIESVDLLDCFTYRTITCDIDGDTFDEALYVAALCNEGDPYDPALDVLTVFRGSDDTGALEFQSFPLGIEAMAIGCADVNGDGAKDVLALDTESIFFDLNSFHTAFHLADSQGGFEPPIISRLPDLEETYSASVPLGADFDRDGRDEFLITAGPGALLLLDYEDGTLSTEILSEPGTTGLWFMDMDDVNGDGVEDFFAINDGYVTFVSILPTQ